MNKQQKLYTFTVRDSNNYPVTEINRFAIDMCMDTAPFHGWAPGFAVELEDTSELDQGSTIYTVNVYGEYLEGAGPIEVDVTPTFTPNQDRLIAAPQSL